MATPTLTLFTGDVGTALGGAPTGPGFLHLTPPEWIGYAGGYAVSPTPVDIPVNADGTFSAQVASCDTGSPSGWCYDVWAEIPGIRHTHFQVQITGAAMDLAAAITAAQIASGTSANTSVIIGPQGVPGPVGPVGPAPTMIEGVGTTLPPGSAVTLDVREVATDTYALDAGIPQGDKGETGDPGVYVGPQPPLDTEKLWVDTLSPSYAEQAGASLGWVGDQISFDGVVSGPHLTGPTGPTPVVGMSGDQIAVDGTITGPHLTGPQGETGAPGDLTQLQLTGGDPLPPDSPTVVTRTGPTSYTLQVASGRDGSGQVSSVNGQIGDVVIADATATSAGLMSGADKTRLDAALTEAPVVSVNGLTGAVRIPLASATNDGLLFAADKAKLDAYPAKPSARTVYDVRDFGALGDGVADDADAIERAFAAILLPPGSGRSGGGTLHFGDGTFLTSRPIVIASPNVTLTGAGVGNTTIKPHPDFTGGAVVKWTNEPTPGTKQWQFLQGCCVRDLTIDCDGFQAIGLQLIGWYNNGLVSNVQVRGFANVEGLTMDPNGMNMCQGINFIAVEVLAENPSTAAAVRLRSIFEGNLLGCKFFNHDGAGNVNPAPVVIIEGCRGLNVYGGAAASGTTGYLVRHAAASVMKPVEGVRFNGVTLENLTTGIEVTGDASNKANKVAITGTRVVGTVTTPVKVDYATVTAIDLTGLGSVNITANAANTFLTGVRTGGTVTDGGVATLSMYYDLGSKFNQFSDRFRIMNGATSLYDFSASSAYLGAPLVIANQAAQTAAPAGGSAGALPAAPSGYVKVKINGVDRFLPYYG